MQKHGIDPYEAERVVRHAKQPYPLYRGDGKWLVWGKEVGGKHIQVVFILDDDDTIFIIHARPLTDREKKQERRRQRR